MNEVMSFGDGGGGAEAGVDSAKSDCNGVLVADGVRPRAKVCRSDAKLRWLVGDAVVGGIGEGGRLLGA